MKYVAFLRAINVGGHIVRMETLRTLFESLKFANVETFIASGNVIFDTRSAGGRKLEQRIEDHLEKSLGYAVATFLRTPAELAAVADHPAFPDEQGDLFIAFLGAPLDAAQQSAVDDMCNDVDGFHVNGREIYWLRRERTSRLSGYHLEKAIRAPGTMRNVNTVRRLVAKLVP